MKKKLRYDYFNYGIISMIIRIWKRRFRLPSLIPDAFGKKTNPEVNPKNMYVTYVIPMDNKVPVGIA